MFWLFLIWVYIFDLRGVRVDGFWLVPPYLVVCVFDFCFDTLICLL